MALQLTTPLLRVLQKHTTCRVLMALAWVLQQGHALVTQSNTDKYNREDLAASGIKLSANEMALLTSCNAIRYLRPLLQAMYLHNPPVRPLMWSLLSFYLWYNVHHYPPYSKSVVCRVLIYKIHDLHESFLPCRDHMCI